MSEIGLLPHPQFSKDIAGWKDEGKRRRASIRFKQKNFMVFIYLIKDEEYVKHHNQEYWSKHQG